MAFFLLKIVFGQFRVRVGDRNRKLQISGAWANKVEKASLTDACIQSEVGQLSLYVKTMRILNKPKHL
ncbi:hypothetical protein DP83_02540 [Vibrio metoecus]|uniref:Uncharacterized protein n=1 Tax=Vibrio metoecus TaxID=1481663 RepID=A0ABR4RZ41_VIBMT|nr:hypothetical protein DP83_02540 [Vibrio metoecus]